MAVRGLLWAAVAGILTLPGPCQGQSGQRVFTPLPRTNAPGPGEIVVRSIRQEVTGRVYQLRGSAAVETSETLLRADEIDYNEETGEAEARGNVRFTSFDNGEDLEADRVEYNLREQTGRFYAIKGTSPAELEFRPALYTSPVPFYFEGKWAERLKDRYILYDGFVTNCRLPKPWWMLRGPRFDIRPGDRAIGRNSTVVIAGAPLLFMPYFYKPLKQEPRKSGFLLPNIGNSSRRGFMLGVGYYWAFHRSYDVMYRSQFFTDRGFAHHVDFRGKPHRDAEFNTYIYGVNDRGLKLPNGERIKQGGMMLSFDGKAQVPWQFSARGAVNYLSSFTFRQAFTETFNEAVYSEVNSIGYLTRHWSSYGLNVVFERHENYQSAEPEDRIVVRKLPSLEFNVRNRELLHARSPLPVWVSLESSAGLVRRNQPLFQTRQFVERLDLAPRAMTALRWKDFHLIPSFGVRGTHYGSSRVGTDITGEGVLRSAGEFSLDLIPPSLARVYDAPHWLGDKLKHVIEPRAGFRYVTGVDNFQSLIRFDDTELLSNTTELELSLTQRLYVKRRGTVNEILSWQVWQKRFFDPDFGGALVEGKRNVLLTQAQLTAYSFLDGPRRYSPVASTLRVSPLANLGVEWRADYDPARERFTNSGLLASYRYTNYFVSAGHNHVRSVPQLTPSANQFIGLAGRGRPDRKGLGLGFSAVYDFRLGLMQFATAQVSYHTDCCGLSFQYRRLNFGARDDHEIRVALALANIGSFGTLRLQERLF